MPGSARETANRKIEVHVEDIVCAGADEVDVLVGMGDGASRTDFCWVRLSLQKMGICWEDEFEMVLAKALRREVSTFAAEKGCLPEAAELRSRIEALRFMMIEKPGATMM